MAQNSYNTSVRFGDGNTNCGNTNNIYNTYMSDEDVQIMNWLSPLEPSNRHEGVRADRLDGAGDWLLETGEFQEWGCSEGGTDKAVLFCSGNPGVGKTFLSSRVIDKLCDRGREENIAVAGLYCDFLAQQEQTTTNIMGAILKQLVGKGGIPNHVREAYQEGKMEFGGRRPRLVDLMGMLKIAIASIPQVFICLDALDECLPKCIPELLESLRDIVRDSPRTRIFLTGRPHAKEDVQRYFSEAVVIPISPNRDDIRNYVEMRLNRDDYPGAMSNDLRVDIVRVVLEKISDIFLLVSLNIDAILAEGTISRRKKKLEEMTHGNGLSEAYTTTLRRLKAQKGYKSELGLKALMWVLHSERPLWVGELCDALGVEIGSADLDPENIPALQTLVASCLGLITIEASSSTVRLVHLTLQEYLSSDPTLFQNPHSTIAEVCLTYLNFRSVRDLSPTLPCAPSTTPLLEYASVYWGGHIRRGMTEGNEILALKLLAKFDEHISAQLLLRCDRNIFGYWRSDSAEGPIGFTGLHGVAYLGIAEIAAAVLDMKEWDSNAADCTGNTALTWAAMRGHDGVVKMLLERKDVNPDQPDTKYGRTPLWWAVKKERKGVVKVLLERENVNPDLVDAEYGRTLLSWAAENGCEWVVKMLLERGDVNPNQVDAIYGRAPLSWAAKNEHEGVVMILLEQKNLNPNQTITKYGQTPLSWAAKKGREGVVKMLLEREDVNPNQPDIEYGRTPLSWAAENGYEAVVKMLLERGDINPDQPDTEYCQTPLSWAAERGREGVVKMLLERGDVNPNQPDTRYGRTPLSWAAGNGHKGVVNMLLERGDINPDHPDTKYGRTPLSWAAENGDEEAVKMLLEREDVKPDQADTHYSLTPLSWAAKGGRMGVIKMLLQRKDVDPNQIVTRYGQTPLSWAAAGGHEEVVKMLLEGRGVDPDQPDTKYGRTPLSWAAGNGHEGAVMMLLEQEGVNLNQPDIEYGRTPLSWAATMGHEGVVKVLLGRGDVDPNQPDVECGRTPLSWAAVWGHVGVVKMLLEREDVNPNQPDVEYGRTPLSWAAVWGHGGVVKMLLERKDINPNQPDTKDGRTPLSWATDRGHEEIVKMLMERKDDRGGDAIQVS